MSKIKSLRLENFQSHEDTLLEFDPGLNTILGPTDSGKTAIFRALRWALYNEPAGDFFIRQGQKSVSVSVEFTNGNIVKRYRTASKNGYEVKIGEDLQVFEGFGSKVPDEVYMASGMEKLSLNDNKDMTINMQDQLEGPFLLSESSSVKASAIGKLVQADVIDRALADVNLDLRRKKIDQGSIEKSIDEKTSKLEDYKYLDDLKARLDKLDNIAGEIEKKKEKQKKLGDLSAKLTSLKPKIEELSDQLDDLKNLDQIEGLVLDLDKASFKYENLENLLSKLRENKTRIQTNQASIHALRYIDTIEDKASLSKKKIDKFKNLKNLAINYKRTSKNLKIHKELLSSLEDLESIASIEESLEARLKLYSNLSDLRDKLTKRQERIQNGIRSVSEMETIDDISRIVDDLNQLDNKLKLLQGYDKNLKGAQKNIASTRKDLELQDKNIKSFIDKYELILKESGICPSCLRPIEDHEYADIKNNL